MERVVRDRRLRRIRGRVRAGGAASALALAVLSVVAAYGVPDGNGALDGVTIVDRAPARQPGYDRSCAQGRGCVFGPAWSDDVDVRLGRNGCDTRNDMLGETLLDKTYRPGTRNCVVIAGRFVDPYTGREVTFAKERAGDVQVDHVFPLSAAWDRGAAHWTPQQRRNFANDPDNLVVTTKSANLSKSDRTPSAWLPTSDAGKCLVARTFIATARTYGLPITTAERAAILRKLDRCG